MRGKPLSDYDGSGTNRITPADAGKTVCRASASIINRDHPRGCGENGISVPSVKTITGSPPRMRGKLAMLMLCALRPGITPADAGKTCKLWRKPLLCRDHPRGCGENTVLRRQASRVRGSPPRMRGKLHGPRRHGENRGITPADAGKTRTRPNPNNVRQDHPRGCGENLITC